MSSRKKRVCDCGQKFSISDKHALCVACRACSRDSMCDVCSVWSQKEWSTFSPSPDVIVPVTQVSDTSIVRGDSQNLAVNQPSDSAVSGAVPPSDVQTFNATECLLVPPQALGSVPAAEVPCTSTVRSDVSPATLLTQAQPVASCSNVASSFDSVTQPTFDRRQSQLPSQNPSSAVSNTGPAPSGIQRPVVMATAPSFPGMQGASFPNTAYQAANPQGFAPLSGFQPFIHPSLYFQSPWNFQTPYAVGQQQQFLQPHLSPEGVIVPPQQPYFAATSPFRVLPSHSEHRSSRTQPKAASAVRRSTSRPSKTSVSSRSRTETARPLRTSTAGRSVARTLPSTSRSHDVVQRQTSPSPSVDDDAGYAPSVVESSQGDVDPDALSVCASDREFDGETQCSQSSAGEQTALSDREADDDTQSVAEGDDDKKDKDKYHSYFSRSVKRVYETFGDECPLPPPPELVESHTLNLMRGDEKHFRSNSLPDSLGLKNSLEKVQSEIKGKKTNALPLAMGKFPLLSQRLRSRYKSHKSLFAAGLPKLDEDTDKVDCQPGNFKSVPVDRTVFHNLGHTVNATVRALSCADWLLARLARIHLSDQESDDVREATRSLGLALAHGLEYSVRTHATLQLLERDAFLNRSSVQLTKQLKIDARTLPFDSEFLFGGKLADLAKAATKHVQGSAWLFGRNMPSMDGSAVATQPKQNTRKAKAGGKARSKSQKARTKPYNPNQRNQGRKPQSATPTSAPPPKTQPS